MKRAIQVVLAGGSVVCGLAACSSAPASAPLPPGAVPAGTAVMTIDGQNAGTTQDVSCLPAGTLTTFTAGDEKTGASSVVYSDQALAVASAQIRNLRGFTGSFNQGLGGDATVSMIARTY